MACIRRWPFLLYSKPTTCTTRADIGKAEIPAAPINGLMRPPVA
jgi:hypothetical protein